MPESPERSAHPLKLTGRSEVAERTVEFRFEKPQSFGFKAGQFMDLTLVDPPETDGEGNTRAFSINSAPDDPDLVFATRLRDTAFKRVLQSMPLGTVVEGHGPFGNLTLHNDTRRPAVLLAGGIGITPFRSIVRWAAHRGTAHRICCSTATGGRRTRRSWRSSGRSSGATRDSRSCRRCSGRGVRARAGTARPATSTRR